MIILNLKKLTREITMDKTIGINRTNTSNPSQSKNQSKQINEVSSKEKKPVLSSKLDGLLDKTDDLLKREKAWKNDNLSNEAKDSFQKTANLIKTKTSDSPVSEAKRKAFSESEKVSKQQREKFGELLELAPLSVLKEITEVKRFPTLNPAELNEVLFTENAFSIVKNIGHIALASVWRDTKGKLQLSICHQESVIPHIKNNGDGKPQKIESYTGIIYNTLDTSAEYPNNISPVIESMKLCGPPSVLVFPCPYPENLEKYTAMMKDTVFDYGAADPWRMPDDKKISKNLPFQTCFNVT